MRLPSLSLSSKSLVLSSKVKTALVLAITGDLGLIVIAISTGQWLIALAGCVTSIIPVVGAWNTTETVFPPLPPGAVAVPIAALAVPAGAVVTMPEVVPTPV